MRGVGRRIDVPGAGKPELLHTGGPGGGQNALGAVDVQPTALGGSALHAGM